MGAEFKNLSVGVNNLKDMSTKVKYSFLQGFISCVKFSNSVRGQGRLYRIYEFFFSLVHVQTLTH